MKSGARALGFAISSDGTQHDSDAAGAAVGGDGSTATARAEPTEPARDGPTATLAGAVVRADRAVEDLVFGTITVGGSDATDAVVDCVERLGRADVRWLVLPGVAPAWFNLFDLAAIHERTDLPVLAVSDETSPGLADAIRDAFDDEETVADRLETYRALPERIAIETEGGTVYSQHVGIEDEAAVEVIRGFTAAERRPEPLRVAKLAASAARAFRSPDRSS